MVVAKNLLPNSKIHSYKKCLVNMLLNIGSQISNCCGEDLLNITLAWITTSKGTVTNHMMQNCILWESLQCSSLMKMQHSIHKCDRLSENPAHPAFYENWDNTGNQYIDVQLCSSVKMEAIGCLVPGLWSEMHLTWNISFQETQCFYIVMVNCNVSMHYCVM